MNRLKQLIRVEIWTANHYFYNIWTADNIILQHSIALYIKPLIIVSTTAGYVFSSNCWPVSPLLGWFKKITAKYSQHFWLNPLDSKGNYSAISNNTKLVHWLLMGGLLHLVQQGAALAGCSPAQSHPHCTKCNSQPINGQCTSHCTAT